MTDQDREKDRFYWKTEEAKMREKIQALKHQLRSVTSRLSSLLSEQQVQNFVRAGHQTVCPHCGQEYIEHPQLPQGPGQWLFILCSGLLAKL